METTLTISSKLTAPVIASSIPIAPEKQDISFTGAYVPNIPQIPAVSFSSRYCIPI